MSRVFLDTNILIYAMDHSDKRKNNTALKLMARHDRSNGAAISTQVIQEFFVVSTGKLKLDPLYAKQAISQFDFDIINIDMDLINGAIDIHQEFQISFWDSLIIVSALKAGSDKIYSEDLHHHQRIRSVVIENPFK